MSAACSHGGGWGLWQSIAESCGLSQYIQGRIPWGKQERQTSAAHSGILFVFPEAAAAPPEEPVSFSPSAKAHAWEWLERVSMVLWFNPSQAGAEPTWDVRRLEDSAKPIFYLLLVFNFKVKKIPCLMCSVDLSWYPLEDCQTSEFCSFPLTLHRWRSADALPSNHTLQGIRKRVPCFPIYIIIASSHWLSSPVMTNKSSSKETCENRQAPNELILQ